MNAALTNLSNATDTVQLGYIIIDDDILAVMAKAAEIATKPARPAVRRNPESARHISFLLRQKAIEMAYASVGR